VRIWPFRRSGRVPVVAILRLSGAIGIGSTLRPGLNLSELADAIERAFSIKRVKAVALQINSPGGSPVQSFLIYKRIRALAEEKEIPVYVFAEDVAASGGYLLSLAGDEIYADKSSVIGSIGVISAGFGFDKLIERYGVDRRVYTSGQSKSVLDPFLPEKAEDVAKLRRIQEDIHGHFINLVKTRRGDRIEKSEEMLFTGEFWSGEKAVELGLIDGIGDLRSKMREVYGEKVKLKLITSERGFFRRRFRLPLGRGGEPGETLHGYLPPGLVEDVVASIESRALWSRFGL